MESVPEPTKTALRAYGMFKRENRNTAQISKLLRIPEPEIDAMVRQVREWIAQERAA